MTGPVPVYTCLAFGDAVGAGAFYEGTESAPQVGHVVADHLRQEGRLVADRVGDRVLAVVGVDLHGLHHPLGRRVDQLRVAARVAVVTLTEFSAGVFFEDLKEGGNETGLKRVQSRSARVEDRWEEGESKEREKRDSGGE